MATIYSILGTDSISSSRLHINNNFDGVNTELIDVKALLDTTAQDLALTGNVTAADGTFSGNLTVTSATTLNSTLDVTGNISTNGAIRYSVAGAMLVGAMPTSNGTYNNYTYLLDGAQIGATCTLYNGNQGQEIMIAMDSATGGDVTVTPTNLAGYTSFTLDDQYEYVILKYIHSIWYVVSSNATLTV
jgi:hypothetical protein